jgi:hypothetical protein
VLSPAGDSLALAPAHTANSADAAAAALARASTDAALATQYYKVAGSVRERTLRRTVSAPRPLRRYRMPPAHVLPAPLAPSHIKSYNGAVRLLVRPSERWQAPAAAPPASSDATRAVVLAAAAARRLRPPTAPAAAAAAKATHALAKQRAVSYATLSFPSVELVCTPSPGALAAGATLHVAQPTAGGCRSFAAPGLTPAALWSSPAALRELAAAGLGSAPPRRKGGIVRPASGARETWRL